MAEISLTPASSDISVEILSRILGPGWGLMLFHPSGPQTVLGTMFSALNNIVLAGVSMIFIYVVFSGVLGTAQEGLFLGKRYSTLWTPIRSVSAVAMLIPMPNGYSILQATILLFTWYGIGAADSLWTVGLKELQARGGTLVSSPASRISNETAGNILRTLTMQQVLRRSGYQVDISEAGWIGEGPSRSLYTATAGFIGFGSSQKNSGNEQGHYPIYFTAAPAKWGHPRIHNTQLGYIKVPCVNASSLCQARRRATLRLIHRLLPIADAFAQHKKLTASQRIALMQSIRQYEADMDQAGKHVQALHSQKLDGVLEKTVKRSTNQGWASAGMWYWTIAGYHDKVSQSTTQKPLYVPPDREYLETLPLSNDLEGPLQRAGAYIQTNIQSYIQDRKLAAAPYEQNTWVARMMGLVTRQLGGMRSPGVVLTEGDPLTSLQSTGYGFLVAGHGVFASKVVLYVSSKVADDAADGFWGWVGDFFSGGFLGGAAQTLSSVSDQLEVPLLLISFYLFVVGTFLAYYLPAVPFLIFTFGFVGWMIRVLEMLVAAPLWGAAHALPEGEGFAGARGSKGYLLFLDVLLRPSLMIFGYFLAIVLIRGVGRFIGVSFEVYQGGAQSGWFAEPVSYFWQWFFVAAVMIVLSHFFFGLITWIPNRALRWLGEHVSTGEIVGGHVATGAMMGAGAAGAGKMIAASERTGSRKKPRNEKGEKTKKDEPGKEWGFSLSSRDEQLMPQRLERGAVEAGPPGSTRSQPPGELPWNPPAALGPGSIPAGPPRDSTS